MTGSVKQHFDRHIKELGIEDIFKDFNESYESHESFVMILSVTKPKPSYEYISSNDISNDINEWE